MKSSTSRLHRLASALVCGTLVVVARAGSAQTVRGKVIAKGDGGAVAGAIVALLDSSGHEVVTRLAEDAGTFQFTAPTAGRYSVRVERVGFRSIRSAPFVVQQGEA